MLRIVAGGGQPSNHSNTLLKRKSLLVMPFERSRRELWKTVSAFFTRMTLPAR
jgi:hypothetical protein